MDCYPYRFYSKTKSVAMAVTNAYEAPLGTVKLHGYDGIKYYLKVKLVASIYREPLFVAIV